MNNLNISPAMPAWHISTPENHEIIFRTIEDFKTGMSLVGITSRLVPSITILTFELMSNHMHFCIIGNLEDIKRFMKLLAYFLERFFKAKGRLIDLSEVAATAPRQLNSALEIRNVLSYDNRNGFLVNPNTHPFSYPWGANKYFFNPEARLRYAKESIPLSIREIRKITRSRKADKIPAGLKKIDGYICPLSFCDIEAAESYYRNASNYFYELSRNIESHRTIAKEIGENTIYSDDELFRIVNSIGKERFGNLPLTSLSQDQKTELAITMHFEYKATKKQIARMLKLDIGVLDIIFPTPQ